MFALIETMRATLTDFNEVSVAVRLILSVLVGGCIGLERGRHGRAAGLRTHVLVCLGATMAALVGLYTVKELGFSSDPMRLGAQVISGIGFLGAGTIMTRNQAQITGLTTAAGLWATASIGLAIGVGFYWAVFVGFTALLLTMTLLPRVARQEKRFQHETIYAELSDISRVNDLFDQIDTQEVDLQIITPRTGISGHVGIQCLVSAGVDSDNLVKNFRSLPNVIIAVVVER